MKRFKGSVEKLCGVEQVRAAWDGCVACGGLGKKDLYEGRGLRGGGTWLGEGGLWRTRWDLPRPKEEEAGPKFLPRILECPSPVGP